MRLCFRLLASAASVIIVSQSAVAQAQIGSAQSPMPPPQTGPVNPVPLGGQAPADPAAVAEDQVTPSQPSAAPVEPFADAGGSGGTSGADIIVTGSRVASNGNQAPTPVTVLPTETLLRTTPTNISDALNTLPQFAGQPGGRNTTNPGNNFVGNFLNLRQFGPQRNLILFDGTRVAPTARAGAVDINVIPQGLIKRVDVVTGGASAVYGSDAVTGVVNFILDTKFSGLKLNSQVGTSTYGDGTTWRIGVVAGTDMLSDRGHLVFSFDHFNNEGLGNIYSRDGADDYPILAGTGAAANPYRLATNGRLSLLGNGGSLINNAVINGRSTGNGNNLPIGLRDITFKTNGVAAPFVHGGATGINGAESGGDGGMFTGGSLLSALKTDQAFAHFSYELTDNVNVYLQGSYNVAKTDYDYLPQYILSAQVLSGNPFIPATVQQAMTSLGASAISLGRLNDYRADYPYIHNVSDSRNTYLKTGVDGTLLGNLKWNGSYSYTRSTQKVTAQNNINALRLAAALDVVNDPATGRAVCQVSLTSAAGRFPGCEPLNLFGPTSPTRSAFDWISDDTFYKLTSELHDFNLGVSGSPFSTWAGPVTLAISGEYRRQSLKQVGNAYATDVPDCSGLRPTANCTPTTALHIASVGGFQPKVYENVAELAAEVLVPLLVNVPFAQRLEFNGAVRYTDYKSSGGVTTWKAGATWQINDDIRIRGARSRDIRAPTLTDLYQPSTFNVGNFPDRYTGVTNVVRTFSQGNSNLKPEKADTTTIGLVLQPGFAPGLSVAVDYFKIKLNDAITVLSGSQTAVQDECIRSAGASPLCALIVRPNAFADRSAANYPTALLSQALNVANLKTEGVDVEFNYRTDLDKISGSLPGSLTLRGLVAYQPKLEFTTFAGQAPTKLVGLAQQQLNPAAASSTGGGSLSKYRVNLQANYAVNGFNLTLTERWQSSQRPSDPDLFVDLRERIPAYSYTDAAISYRWSKWGPELETFLTVQNIGNKKPPICGGGAGNPGVFHPACSNFDIIGRYFTAGVRAKF